VAARSAGLCHVNTTLPEHGARLDKWLWALRLFKSRSLAAEACRSGGVHINQLPAKPARELKVGEQLTVRIGLVTRTLLVLGSPRGRVSAKQVPEYLQDLTPPAEYERARAISAQNALQRARGTGRPTKRDRRLLDDWLGP